MKLNFIKISIGITIDKTQNFTNLLQPNLYLLLVFHVVSNLKQDQNKSDHDQSNKLQFHPKQKKKLKINKNYKKEILFLIFAIKNINNASFQLF